MPIDDIETDKISSFSKRQKDVFVFTLSFIATYLITVVFGVQRDIGSRLIAGLGSMIIYTPILLVLLATSKFITKKTRDWYGLYLSLVGVILAFWYYKDFLHLIR